MRKSSAIKATIKSLGRNTATVRNKFQAVLCEVAAHAYVNGDPRLYSDILDAAQGLNRKLMVKWINTYGFARVTKEGVLLNKSARDEADFADGDAVIEYLTNEVPAWYVAEESVEQGERELDLIAGVKSLRARRAKMNVKSYVYAELLAECEALLEDARNDLKKLVA